ncbi:MAG: hypothetical protein HYY34_00440 [Chloroflexi bacterium]|nr:hypothetical protein [Chloroflexota bacterium]
MTPIWIKDRVWCETLLIPPGEPAQNLFRTLFASRREQDLAVDRSSPSRSALDWAVRQVRDKFPGYRPLVHASLIRS